MSCPRQPHTSSVRRLVASLTVPRKHGIGAGKDMSFRDRRDGSPGTPGSKNTFLGRVPRSNPKTRCSCDANKPQQPEKGMSMKTILAALVVTIGLISAVLPAVADPNSDNPNSNSRSNDATLHRPI